MQSGPLIKITKFIDKQFGNKLKKFLIPVNIQEEMDIRIVVSNLSLEKKSSSYLIKEIVFEKMI
jgi:hypothetical protein